MQTNRDSGGVIVCTETALCTEVNANGHDLVADEPAAHGAPRPVPHHTITC